MNILYNIWNDRRSHCVQDNHVGISRYALYGISGVGKSSMLIRYVKGQFSEQYNVTVGVEFATKAVEVEDGKKEVKLQIWDTVNY